MEQHPTQFDLLINAVRDLCALSDELAESNARLAARSASMSSHLNSLTAASESMIAKWRSEGWGDAIDKEVIESEGDPNAA
jgi:hypothetical protein